MPYVRRRVYLDRSLSRQSQMEAWLSYSIVLAVGMLVLCLLICLPQVATGIVTAVLPAKLALRLGVVTDTADFVTTLCETLASIAGVYLILALCLKSSTRHAKRNVQ
jgi:hypothetical protein